MPNVGAKDVSGVAENRREISVQAVGNFWLCKRQSPPTPNTVIEGLCASTGHRRHCLASVIAVTAP